MITVWCAVAWYVAMIWEFPWSLLLMEIVVLVLLKRCCASEMRAERLTRPDQKNAERDRWRRIPRRQ